MDKKLKLKKRRNVHLLEDDFSSSLWYHHEIQRSWRSTCPKVFSLSSEAVTLVEKDTSAATAQRFFEKRLFGCACRWKIQTSQNSCHQIWFCGVCYSFQLSVTNSIRANDEYTCAWRQNDAKMVPFYSRERRKSGLTTCLIAFKSTTPKKV